MYKPHGIHFGGIGSAPLPARRNMRNPPNRPRQPFGHPLGMGFDPQALGSRRFIQPLQEGFAPHPGMRFDPRLPQIPGFELPHGYQGPPNIIPYQAPDPRPFGVHGSLHISDPQIAPGYQGSRDIALQQAFGPNPFAAQGPPKLSGPAYPPGYQPRFEPSLPPMNPWFGLPVPTPMGPYSQRRPVKPLPVLPKSPLMPLRDLDDHNTESAEYPDDTWKGAIRDKVPRSPKPDELQALLPPYLRVNRPRGKVVEGGEMEEGYRDEEEENENNMPEYSEEKDYVTTKPTSLSPQYVTRGLGQSTASVTPPPLLADDALLNDETPLDDALSSEAEWFSNIAAENMNEEWFNDAAQNENVEGFSDDASDEQRRERLNSFDHLLLVH